jgi:salicylate hydroxylase
MAVSSFLPRGEIRYNQRGLARPQVTGIVEDLKCSGCQVRKAVLKNTAGETLSANPTNRYLEKYGQPLLTVWWWRFQQVLASRLPSDIIHLNHHCTGFDQNDKSVEIHFDNGKQVHADLL